MNVFLLMVALAAPVEAPKAGLHEAAAAPAAVASVSACPEGVAVQAAVATASECPEGAAVQAAVATASECPEGAAVQAAVASAPECPEGIAVVKTEANDPLLGEAKAEREAAPGWIGVFPQPDMKSACDLAEAYAQGRFLSAPWSARRRLEAARIRGDEDEARRIEAMMDTLVVEALATEGP